MNDIKQHAIFSGEKRAPSLEYRFLSNPRFWKLPLQNTSNKMSLQEAIVSHFLFLFFNEG